MKKRIIVGIASILFLLLISTYLFIPSKIRVSQIQSLPVPPGAVARCFNNLNKIKDWWPGKTTDGEDTITYKGYRFKFSKFTATDVLNIIIFDAHTDSVNSFVTISPSGKDSSFAYWSCDLKATLSPLNRISQYQKGVEIKETITEIMRSLLAYSANTKNIYGISIARERVPDSILISEKKDYIVYPGVQEIYSSINSMKEYLTTQNAKQVNFPICNITPKDSGGFSLIVAIPINKTIKETEVKKIKGLLYNGNILTTEVTGGVYKINKAMDVLGNFIIDYQLTPAVLPFQSLLIDREKVTDSTKWVTKICFPVY